MSPVEDVLVHVGTPIRKEGTGAWIEGERDVEPVELTPFDCCLFLPLGTEQQGGFRSRQVSAPTLIYGPLDQAGQPVSLSPNDELKVRAPELAQWAGAEEVIWKVDGEPQPAGHPGDTPIVVQARLEKVSD